MKRKMKIRSKLLERKVINNRAYIMMAIMGVMLLGLVCHLYDLQINQQEAMASKAKRNSIKSLKLAPERGDIVDRNGVVLATTRSMYNLIVIPERISGFRKDKTTAADEYLTLMVQFIDLPKEEYSEARKKIIKSRGYEKITIKRDLQDKDLSIVLENIAFMEGTSIQAKRVRHYPYGETFLSPIGYVGRISEKDIGNWPDRKFIDSDYIGKMGIEKIYDLSLYGEVGEEVVALDARGNVKERLIKSRAKKGSSIPLTIDHQLQSKAYELLKGYRGAVVVSDINTGELLTLLSSPAIDPNTLIGGMTQSQVKQMYSPDRPLYNRAIRGQYPPGSTIKGFMALAGLQGEFITDRSVRWSGPYFSLGGHKFRDWKRQGHGHVTVTDAIAVSSDVFFYRLANDMGIDYIHDYFYELGFGRKTGVGLDYESEGLMPSSEWKRRVKGMPWYAGETVTVGIGQGYFMSTPIQLNNALVAILNGGTLYVPNIIKGLPHKVLNEVTIPQEYIDVAVQGMKDVIYSKKGTARAIRSIAEVPMAGKTGTSQVFSTNGSIEYENADIQEKLRDHALFIGFAPMDVPKVAITVIIENGGSGSGVAAPIAQKMANEWFRLERENNKDEVAM